MLTNPEFHIQIKIDFLIGAEIFFELLRSNKIILDDSCIILQDSVFGYITTRSLDGTVHENIIIADL